MVITVNVEKVRRHEHRRKTGRKYYGLLNDERLTVEDRGYRSRVDVVEYYVISGGKGEAVFRKHPFAAAAGYPYDFKIDEKI